MGDYITTYTGKHFYVRDPVAADIQIEDIAHALSLLCRGNGHVKHFFSVGQHCIACLEEAAARRYSDRLCLACLLHDASEAYMSDVTRPLKQHMPDYIAWEERLLRVIYEKFLGSDLTEEERGMVKRVDDDLLYYDLLHLMGERSEQEAPKLHHTLHQETLPFEKVESRYLQLFALYRERIKM